MAVATKTGNGHGKTRLGDFSGEDAVKILIPAITVARARLTLVGLSPLIVDNGASAVAKLEKLQSAAPKEKKQPREPETDFKNTIYRTKKGGYGFPSLGIKKSLVTAIGRFTEMPKTQVNGLVRIAGDEMLAIRSSEPRMRRDMVVASMRHDVRYRAEFWPWAIDIEAEFIPQLISLEQVVHGFRLAGQTVGIGNWRPEKSGSFGTYDVENVKA